MNTMPMGMAILLGVLLVLFAYSVQILQPEDPCNRCKNCQDCGESCKNCTNCEQYFNLTRSCTIAMAIGAGVGVPFVPYVLAFLGFAGAGVTAGSLAALWQSIMGGIVVKGGIFSLLQSIGAAGLGFTGTFVVSGAAGTAMCMFCKELALLTGMDMKCSWQINCT